MRKRGEWGEREIKKQRFNDLRAKHKKVRNARDLKTERKKEKKLISSKASIL